MLTETAQSTNLCVIDLQAEEEDTEPYNILQAHYKKNRPAKAPQLDHGGTNDDSLGAASDGQSDDTLEAKQTPAAAQRKTPTTNTLIQPNSNSTLNTCNMFSVQPRHSGICGLQQNGDFPSTETPGSWMR